MTTDVNTNPVRDILLVNSVNGATLATVTLTDIDLALKITCSFMAICYTAWKWHKDIKKKR